MRQGRYSRADATYSDDKHSLREHLSLQLTAAPAGRNEALQLRQRSVPYGLAISADNSSTIADRLLEQDPVGRFSRAAQNPPRTDPWRE